MDDRLFNDSFGESEWYGQDGGMLIGRQAALADWAFRKEQKEFEKLVTNLKARKWAKTNPEKRKQILAKSKARPEYKAAQQRARKLARLKAWLSKSGTALTCGECREQFRRKRGGRIPTFCSGLCRSNHGYQKRTPGARRIKRRVRARQA